MLRISKCSYLKLPVKYHKKSDDASTSTPNIRCVSQKHRSDIMHAEPPALQCEICVEKQQIKKSPVSEVLRGSARSRSRKTCSWQHAKCSSNDSSEVLSIEGQTFGSQKANFHVALCLSAENDGTQLSRVPPWIRNSTCVSRKIAADSNLQKQRGAGRMVDGAKHWRKI